MLLADSIHLHQEPYTFISVIGNLLQPDPKFTLQQMREFGSRFVQEREVDLAPDSEEYEQLLSSLSQASSARPIAAATSAAEAEQDLLSKMVPESARKISALVKQHDVQMLDLDDIETLAYRGISKSRLPTLGVWIAAAKGLDKTKALVVEKLPVEAGGKQRYKVLEGNHRIMALRALAKVRDDPAMAEQLEGMSWKVPAICLDPSSTSPEDAMAYAACELVCARCGVHL